MASAAVFQRDNALVESKDHPDARGSTRHYFIRWKWKAPALGPLAVDVLSDCWVE